MRFLMCLAARGKMQREQDGASTALPGVGFPPRNVPISPRVTLPTASYSTPCSPHPTSTTWMDKQTHGWSCVRGMAFVNQKWCWGLSQGPLHADPPANISQPHAGAAEGTAKPLVHRAQRMWH
uniref:Uncharacterized protein n=1 Tax=Phasianus colchicus TaxID=9054 RepID=A0A669QNL4_PHACC